MAKDYDLARDMAQERQLVEAEKRAEKREADDDTFEVVGYDSQEAFDAAMAAWEAQQENEPANPFQQEHAAYRAEVRSTFQAMSDEALAYQATVVVGGIDREELDRELERRRDGR